MVILLSIAVVISIISVCVTLIELHHTRFERDWLLMSIDNSDTDEAGIIREEFEVARRRGLERGTKKRKCGQSLTI